jgi:hypothetical protein
MTMIRLKQLLREMSEQDIQRCLNKIKNSEFRLIGAGDNGRVYEINGEDKVFKITKEQDEYKVAERIVNQFEKYTTFIPVYYVNGSDMYIMANADPIPEKIKKSVNLFMQDFSVFARAEGGEVSIFDFVEETDNIDPILDNFLNALKTDIDRLQIPDFELDLDFRADNIMIWNGKMVMVDW